MENPARSFHVQRPAMKTPLYKIVTTDPERIFSLEQAADLTGMHTEMILEFVRANLIHVQLCEKAPQFDEAALVRIRHIENLRQEHVNLRTVCYIIHLLDRLESSERELRTLRERLR